MLRIYGSEFCPHCTACKKALDAEGTEYEYIDINKSLGALKEFLKLRDTDPVFKEVIGSGRVGIPALVLPHRRHRLLKQAFRTKTLSGTQQYVACQLSVSGA